MQQGRSKLNECHQRLEALETGRAQAALLEAMKGTDVSVLESAIQRASAAGVSAEAYTSWACSKPALVPACEDCRAPGEVLDRARQIFQAAKNLGAAMRSNSFEAGPGPGTVDFGILLRTLGSWFIWSLETCGCDDTSRFWKRL